jgi:2-dehydro-3-deoxy-D-arabinonate dehydratase
VHLFRFHSPEGFRLGLEVADERFDLTAAAREFVDISTWLALTEPLAAIHDILPRVRRLPLSGEVVLVAPLDVQEVWASGVTYLRSKVARREESSGDGGFYDLVYEAQRPELFFKSMPQRVVGNRAPVRIRRDSVWNVPEPELVLVLSAGGTIVGFTIGNDMSSRSIEGENPLYLPQAKVYDGSCSLGPWILLNDGLETDRTIRMTITRSGSTVFDGTTSTSAIRRSLTELSTYLFRELTFNTGVFLFTGTGIVPPDDFTLQPGDLVSITIEGIGTLENPVETRL